MTWLCNQYFDYEHQPSEFNLPLNGSMGQLADGSAVTHPSTDPERVRLTLVIARAAHQPRIHRCRLADAFWPPPTDAPPPKRLLYYQYACAVNSEHARARAGVT